MIWQAQIDEAGLPAGRKSMSIDNRYYVPAGAKSNPTGYPRTKYKCGDRMLEEQLTKHQVFYAHGGFLIDEQYFFESADDARWYFEEGYKRDLLQTDGIPEKGIPPSREWGPSELHLWIDGEEINKPSNDRQLEPEQAAAKAVLLEECDKLAAAGVTLVAVHFDGSGDDGATEAVRCFDSEDYDYDRKSVEHDASHLQDHFDALVPYGFEINAGGFGDVVLDVKKRKITVEYNERIEDCTTTTYEV